MDGYYSTEAPLLEHAKELKKILKIPVMMPNCHKPDIALEAITNGTADIIALGRPMMADPNYVNKVKQNRVKDINKCQKDNFCFIPFRLGLPGRCQANPELGRERYNPKYWVKEGYHKTEMFPEVLKSAMAAKKRKGKK